uniref:Nuclear transport factor 2 family protein n=1 Tax=Caenorhabditis tropicalis TaxID=1561998 RepID=A0A1I7UPL2_9PELO
MAEEIVDKITKTIQTKDPNIISGIFREDFTFYSCIGPLNEKQFIEYLTQIPSKPDFKIIVDFTDRIRDSDIRVYLSTTGLALNAHLMPDFTLTPYDFNYKTYVISRGVIRTCLEHTRKTINVARKFLDKMTNAIKSKDEGAISELFAPDFTFKSCEIELHKEKFVSVLKQLPAYASSFSYYLFASYDHEGFNMFTASMIRFNQSEVIVTFHLNKKDQNLKRMLVVSCPTS